MNANIQPGSPRPAGISPKSRIQAKKVFEDVNKGIAHERRTDNAKQWGVIDNLKDNRGFFHRMFGFLVTDVDNAQLYNDYKGVKTEFEKYKDVGVTIPDDIASTFEYAEDKPVHGGFAYIDTDNAEKLKDLAYQGEQNLQFNEQLKNRPGAFIEGNLEDYFKRDGKVQEPNKKVLSSYCDSLKKIFEKNGYFPDSVTSNPEPNVFVFHFRGEKPKVVTVNSIKDLKELQQYLGECTILSANAQGSDKPLKIIATDPFGIKEGDAKRDIMAKLGQLNVDPRSTLTRWWDNFVGLVTKSANVQALEKANQDLIKTIESEFNKVVGKDTVVGDIVLKNKSFDEAVLSKQPDEVKAKLKSGERLTADEVKQLQADTFRAMKYQRYLDDLRSSPIPVKFELGDLVLTEMPDEIVFERYLHKLKEELIKGNYPPTITADPDVHKFIFFNRKGEYEEVIVESFEDLLQLQKRLDVCVADAQKERGKLNLYFTPEQLERKLAAAEAMQKRQQAELEALKAEQEQLKAAATKVAEERDKAIAEREELAKKGGSTASELQSALAMGGELRKAAKVAEQRASAAEVEAAKVEKAALARVSEAGRKAREAEAKLEKLRIETTTMAEQFKRLDANQKAAIEFATKAKEAADQQVAKQIAELSKAVEVATAKKDELEKEQQLIATQLASAKEGADKTNLEKQNLEKKAQLDAAEKETLTQRANLAEAEIEHLKAETLLNTAKIAELQTAQKTLENQHDKATEDLRTETSRLRSKVTQLEADIKKQIVDQEAKIMGKVGEKLEVTAIQLEKEATLKAQLEVLKKEKDALEKKLIDNRKLADKALVAEYLINQFQNLNYSQGYKYANHLLFMAVTISDLEVINKLLSMENDEINFNAQDYYGTTPLHLAVGEKQIDVTKLLLRRNGIDVNLADLFGNTALHFAVKDYKNDDIVDALLSIENIKVNLVNKKGETPLNLAVRLGSVPMVRKLIRKEADVNIVDMKGNTPLHYAVEYIDMLNALFSADEINLNIKNLAGFTSLHLAVIKGDFDVVEALINKGANLEIQDNQNKRALDLASEALVKYSSPDIEGYSEAKKIYDLLKEKTPPTAGEAFANMADYLP